MDRIDWSVLSGPRVSRRTMMKLAAATGAGGFAATLGARAQAAAAARVFGAVPARQEPKQGGTLRLGFGLGQIPTLDPAQVNLGIVAGELLSNLFSGLVQFDAELGIIPDLAESWEVSPDGLQYTFRLRPNLTFHNDAPLAAQDFIYTYQRTIDPALASPQANKLALITEMTAPDPQTVVIRARPTRRSWRRRAAADRGGRWRPSRRARSKSSATTSSGSRRSAAGRSAWCRRRPRSGEASRWSPSRGGTAVGRCWTR